MGEWNFLRNLNYRRTVKSILLIKMFLGLAEVTFRLVYASFSLPKWQASKMTFLAPWAWHPVIQLWVLNLQSGGCLPTCSTLPLNTSWAQLFEDRLALNLGFFFWCSKAFSLIIFSVIFRVSNHQLVDKKNKNWNAF